MKQKKRRDAGRARGEPIVDTVLACTLEELASVGLAALSVERIAKKAEVNKTSVYRRWPTKEALVAAAMERALGEVTASVPDTGSLRGDLLALLTPVCALIESERGRSVIRASLAADAGSSVEEISARQLPRVAVPVREVMARARARGEWASGANAQQLVFMLVGALVHRALFERAPLSRKWLADLVDLALQGALVR